MSIGRTIAVLHVDHYMKWKGPFGNFDEMGIQLLMDTNRGASVQFEIYDAFQGYLPSIEQLKNKDKYMGVYITGSQYDSFDTESEWINNLRKFVREYVKDDNQNGSLPPLVGICFAHQMLASALGGYVGRNNKGMEGGVVSVQLNKVGMKLFQKETLNLSMIHRDAVLAPLEYPGLVNWGSSEQCEWQGFYKPACLLTFQGHPEFTTEIARGAWQHSVSQADRNGITTQLEQQWERETSRLANDGYGAAARAIWRLFEGQL